MDSNYSAIDTTVLSVALNSARIASNGVCLCFLNSATLLKVSERCGPNCQE